MVSNEQRIGKDVKGSDSGQFKVVPRHLPGGTDKRREAPQNSGSPGRVSLTEYVPYDTCDFAQRINSMNIDQKLFCI
jgi:hypothetical protein